MLSLPGSYIVADVLIKKKDLDNYNNIRLYLMITITVLLQL